MYIDDVCQLNWVFVHLNQNLTNISYYLKCIQQRINDQALQNQNNLITGSTKLEFFSSVHKTFYIRSNVDSEKVCHAKLNFLSLLMISPRTQMKEYKLIV